MKTEIENGGPAFPVTENIGMNGMTLRDYFAGQVINTLTQRYAASEDIARIAYSIADAMLVQR